MPENEFVIELEDGEYHYECGTEYNEELNKKTKYIVVITDKDDSFDEILNDKNSFESSKRTLEVDYTYEEFISEPFKVKLNGKIDDIIHFLNKNKINNRITLGSKNNEPFKITDEVEINKLLNELNNTSNIYLNLEGNNNEISIDDYKYTVEYINSIVKEIKEKELSTFEELIYLYDIVRDRYYISEEKNDDPYISRDLTKVIKGKKIVCIGYSEIFNTIAKKLGFNAKKQLLHDTPKNEGHARNMVYVKDDKYNIDEILVFDPTTGCKIDETNNHFNKYSYCGRPNAFFEYIDEYFEEDLIDDEMEILKNVYKKLKENDFNLEPIEYMVVNSMYKQLLNKEFSIIYRFNLNEDKELQETFKEEIITFCNLFDKREAEEIYIKALTNVRIKEYLDDEEKFPLSIEKLMEINPNRVNELEEETQKRINGVRLIKTLRKVLENEE